MTARTLAMSACLLALVSAGTAARADPRITERAYHGSEITILRAGPGIESTIAFAPDERIENIALGDSAAWQVTPNKRANLIFVKPANSRARTNMTVVTDQRTYLFDLVSGSSSSAIYMLRFSYPDAPKMPAKADPATVALAAAAPPPPAQPQQPEVRYAWRAKGEKSLIPSVFFDDGRSTYLHWDKDDTLPAILSRGPNGAEGPVNYTVRDTYIVVDGVPAQLVLRNGKQVATLTPEPRRVPTSSMTASADPILPQVDEARQ